MFGPMTPWSVLFLLGSVSSLKCFSDVDGVEMSLCEEKRGYRTCFIKYDQRGQVTGRGCSTYNKLFFTECENHVIVGEGAGSTPGGERICYCGTFLCNTAAPLATTSLVLYLLIVLNY